MHLVERHGRLVTKQELMTALWPDTFVEEANLTYTVSALRKPPRRLFATDIVPPSTTVEEYTVSQDGQRFLMLEPISKSRNSIGVILNWTALVSAPAVH